MKGLSPSHTGRTRTEKLPSEVGRDGQVSWGVLVGARFSTELFIERAPQVSPNSHGGQVSITNRMAGALTILLTRQVMDF